MVVKQKSILRERVWWPGLATDAENWVKSCQTCAVNGLPEKPTPMKRILAPQAVWETVALDFNGPYTRFGNISILLIVDYRSRFLIARPVKSTGFEETGAILDEIFDREGYPKFIRSDNGPPFNGDEYKNYCAERDIEATFSTPLFPQQNGLVENYMKLVNKAMAAAVSNGTNFKKELKAAIAAHNSAAHSVTGAPPEEVMYGRKIKRRLPLLQPGKADHDEQLLNRRDKEEKLKAKEREDARRGARKCRVGPGDTVIVERHTRAKGDSRFDPQRYIVIKQDNGSLVLQNDQGQVLKRHVTQTKKVGHWREHKDRETSKREYECADRGRTQARPSTESSDRPRRERNPPTHLKDYVRALDTSKQ